MTNLKFEEFNPSNFVNTSGFNQHGRINLIRRIAQDTENCLIPGFTP